MISRSMLLLGMFFMLSCTALPPPQEWFGEEGGGAAASYRSPPPPPVEKIRRLSWEEALRLARERNPTVEAALKRMERAEALLREAGAASYPALAGRLGYVRFIEAADFRGRSGTDVSGSSTRTRFFTGRGSDIYSGGLDATYPLFDGGRDYYSQRAAGHELEARKQDYEQALNDLSLRVTEAFLSLLLAGGQIDIATEALRFSRQEEEKARERAAAGEGSKVDELRFAARVSEDQLALNAARAARRSLLAALGELIGAEIDEEAPIAGPEKGLELPPASRLELALRQRPELKSLNARIKSSENRLSLEKAAWWPSLSAFGSYGAISLDDLKLNHDKDEFLAGGNATLNLFTGGATLARQRAAQKEIEELKSQERELVQKIDREIRQAEIDLEAARENVAVSERSVQLAEEVLARVTAQYRAGDALVLDVTAAELQRTAARLAYLRNQIEQLRSQARLRHAVGLPVLEPEARAGT
ncbi:MAG: TolC family protein [Planctomycetes bacterium]|nr:TolC family protein [Planctomycetota bacterium]